MSSYLDKAGLSRFWSAIKSYVDAHSGGGVSLSSVYPVGTIYMSVNSTSPATLFGGTWERLTDRFLSSQAYAVYDSTDQSMTFFRDDKGKYTDGQVSGTKTYYTGFEDITGETDPSWYASSSDNQKNTIKTVTFEDKIKPKTCYDWFSNASSLASITGLYKLDTSAVTNMCYMFYRCSSLTSLDLSSFNTENVTNMDSMFDRCSSLTSLGLSSFNTENVTNMNFMFRYCSSLTSLDVSSFNTAKVTGMKYMFYRCSRLKTIYASSLFTTNMVRWSIDMFDGCTSLVGGAGTTYDANHTDKTYARIDGGASNPGYFTAKTVTPSSQATEVYMWRRTA